LRSIAFAILFTLAVVSTSATMGALGWTPGHWAPLNVTATVPDYRMLSARGAAFLKEIEGFYPTAYPDAGGGWSIGYGFQKWKGRQVTPTYPKRVTRAQADAEFIRQLGVYESIVRAEFKQGLPQPAFDALVSMSYNMGRVGGSVLLKVKRGKPVAVSDFTASANVKGEFHPSVYYRRLREYLVFLGRYDDAMMTTFKSVTHAKATYRELLSERVSLNRP
jgi:GH24 family phage-related lysozyme (muramidase)